MSYLFLLLSACSVLAVTAAPQGNDKAKQCCSPTSWQATMTNTSTANNAGRLQFSRYYVDYDMDMDAMAYFSMDSETLTETPMYRLVNDYKNHFTYQIVGSECKRQPNRRSLGSHCVPANATYLGSSYVGFPNVGVAYDAWRYKWDIFTVTIALTPDTCVPIIEGVKGTGIDVVYFFNQYVTPMKNQSAFKVPPGC